MPDYLHDLVRPRSCQFLLLLLALKGALSPHQPSCDLRRTTPNLGDAFPLLHPFQRVPSLNTCKMAELSVHQEPCSDLSVHDPSPQPLRKQLLLYFQLCSARLSRDKCEPRCSLSTARSLHHLSLVISMQKDLAQLFPGAVGQQCLFLTAVKSRDSLAAE